MSTVPSLLVTASSSQSKAAPYCAYHAAGTRPACAPLGRGGSTFCAGGGATGVTGAGAAVGLGLGAGGTVGATILAGAE